MPQIFWTIDFKCYNFMWSCSNSCIGHCLRTAESWVHFRGNGHGSRGTNFSSSLHFSLAVIIPPVLHIWPVWFSMPQLICSAQGLVYTLPVQLHKITDLKWEAKCTKGVW